MNPFDSAGGEAILDYDDGEFHIVKPGAYVVCAVTKARVPVKSLRYWNVDKQEPYANAAAAMVGFGYRDGE